MELKKCFLLSLLLLVMAAKSSEANLRPDYYSKTCPNVESIVFQAVKKKLFQTFVTAPATLRLFFHDCMVTGCDASVMISLPEGNAEKDASDNLSLAGDGFDTVVKAKQAVESKCRGVVSCADILALAARDVVALTGGPNFTVELGRLDGFVSSASLVPGRLPAPEFNLNKLLHLFHKNNMSIIDLVALSGAHTIGFSHCSRFRDRLYAKGSCKPQVDPTLNPAFASRLMQACPCNVNPNIAIDMDPYTAAIFDNKYYKNLQNLEGLFTSDEVLYTDGRSKPYVNKYAASQAIFFRDFGLAMQKVGRVGVKSGKQGNIRLDCTKFN